MKIISRNVNGIRAVINKGFDQRFQSENPDILCIQEPKAFEHQIPAEIKFLTQDYSYIRHAGTRPGYAGTAIFYKKDLEVLDIKNQFPDIPEFYEDGRVVEIRFKNKNLNKNITLLNLYFPNGGERADGTEMLTYKLDFYDKFINYINSLRDAGEAIITTGDFNICHKEIDIARPKENENSIGFLPIERAKLDELQSNGYIDIFRHFYPDLKDKYTRWSYRAGARPRNVGRRLDYFWVSEDILPLIQKMGHQDDVMGSDHCPIVLELKG